MCKLYGFFACYFYYKFVADENSFPKIQELTMTFGPPQFSYFKCLLVTTQLARRGENVGGISTYFTSPLMTGEFIARYTDLFTQRHRQ